MAVYKENDCVGCPDYCRNCGRNEDYYVFECDECGYESADIVLFKINGKELCRNCAIEAILANKTKEDIIDIINEIDCNEEFEAFLLEDEELVEECWWDEDGDYYE